MDSFSCNPLTYKRNKEEKRKFFQGIESKAKINNIIEEETLKITLYL